MIYLLLLNLLIKKTLHSFICNFLHFSYINDKDSYDSVISGDYPYTIIIQIRAKLILIEIKISHFSFIRVSQVIHQFCFRAKICNF